MSSLSRTIEGWMGDDLYRKLGNEPDIELTWKLLRNLIGQQLFASEYVTVPHFDSAIYYNQLFAFKKKRSLWSCFGIRCPVYKTVGNLDYLVDRSLSTWTPQFDFSPWDVADGLSMYREYRLNVASNTNHEAKSIELVVMGAHARSAQPPMPGSLTIHTNLLQDLEGCKTLYVINDVVFASYVRLSVRIGTRHKTVIYDIDTPIGFKYRKYKVRPDGRFVKELYTNLKLTEKDAGWLKPTPQPVPWRDLSCRRFPSPGLRKTRNNLTIRSPEGPRGRGGGRTWAQEAGTLRDDRPVRVNASAIHAAVQNDHDDQDNQNEEWSRSVQVHSQRRSIPLNNLSN